MTEIKPWEDRGTHQRSDRMNLESCKIALRIRTEEHDCCAEDLIALRTAANALLHQIDIGDFVDSNGHSAKMLKPVHDLMKLLGKPA